MLIPMLDNMGIIGIRLDIAGISTLLDILVCASLPDFSYPALGYHPSMKEMLVSLLRHLYLPIFD